jgi:hypothetical protein
MRASDDIHFTGPPLLAHVVRRPPSDFIGVYSYQYWSKPSVGKTTNQGGGKRRLIAD